MIVGMMLSVDLFTGIGGFVLGLEGICRPIVYCDNDQAVLRTLDRLMLEGSIPKATVVDDVTKLPEILKAVGGRDVDVVTAGFPCVGFSDFGHRQGLKDERSGLFHAAMNVVKALRPKMVFLENVHKVVNSNGGRDFKVILTALHKAGYDCRWSTCKASDVGMHQNRKRWFCLCMRRGVDFSSIKFPVRKHVMHKQMPTVLAKRSADYATRYHALGNAIVPSVARFAFERLVCGFVDDGKVIRFAPVSDGIITSKPSLHGFCVKGKSHWVLVNTRPQESYEIVLDPSHYRPEYTPKNVTNRAQPIVSQYVLHYWPTPRATAPRHSNSLTVRNIRDLPTVALFASRVNGVRQPKAVQGMTVNPEFVEWLMGFPKGWTRT